MPPGNLRQSRAVLVLGVPFPGATDRCVMLKRAYNNRCARIYVIFVSLFHSSGRRSVVSSMLDGNTWYKMQVIHMHNSFSNMSSFFHPSPTYHTHPHPSSLIFPYKTHRLIISSFYFVTQHYQAFRAANQAIGRCIRHKADYGRYWRSPFTCKPFFHECCSVFFVDARFGADDRLVQMNDDQCYHLQLASYACH
jgi:hypothetical protein